MFKKIKVYVEVILSIVFLVFIVFSNFTNLFVGGMLDQTKIRKGDFKIEVEYQRKIVPTGQFMFAKPAPEPPYHVKKEDATSLLTRLKDQYPGVNTTAVVLYGESPLDYFNALERKAFRRHHHQIYDEAELGKITVYGKVTGVTELYKNSTGEIYPIVQVSCMKLRIIPKNFFFDMFLVACVISIIVLVKFIGKKIEF